MIHLAPSLVKLRDECNAAWPARQKQTDGWIADNAHGSTSKHQPQNSLDGQTVRAQDITQSLPVLDTNWLADRIAYNILAGTEKRVLGIGSWNTRTRRERWFSLRDGVWGWLDQDLHGASHEGHMHLEIINERWAYDDTSSWNLIAPVLEKPKPPAPPAPLMPIGDTMLISNGTKTAVTDFIVKREIGSKQLAAYQTAWKATYGKTPPTTPVAQDVWDTIPDR